MMKTEWKTARNDIDTLMKIAYKVRFESIECPPSQEIWAGIESRIQKKKRADFIRRLKPAIAATVIIAVLTTLLVNYQVEVIAFANNFIKNIAKITEESIFIRKSFDRNGERDSDLPKRMIDKVKEIQEKVPFRLKIPGYVPKGFELTDVKVINDVSERQTVSLYYSNLNSAGDNDCFTFIQKNIIENASLAINAVRDRDTNVEYRTIGGIEYTIVNYNDEEGNKQQNTVIWDTGNVSYQLDGSISVDEMIRISSRLKYLE